MSNAAFSRVRAVLFDVLHTLVDDSGFPRYQLRTLLEEEGYSLDSRAFEAVYNRLTAEEYDWEVAAVERPFRTMKDRHRARLEALYRHFRLGARRDLAADIEQLWEKIATSAVYPEVGEVLPALERRGYRLALISNADDDDPVIRALFRAEMPVSFEVVVTSQGVGAYKPDTSIFEHALQGLGLGPEEVVLVGDSPASDVMGARRVGMPAIWINRREIDFPDGYPTPDARIWDLRGLLTLLPGSGADGQ